MPAFDKTSDRVKIITLINSSILSIVFLMIAILSVRTLFELFAPKQGNRRKASFLLITYIVSWTIVSSCGIMFNLYTVIFWKLSYNYDVIVFFVLGLMAYGALFPVFIARWFLTLECIFVIKMWHTQRRYLNLLCTIFSVIITSAVTIFCIIRFVNSDKTLLQYCWVLPCGFEPFSFLVAINLVNVIVLSSFFCSLFSLYFFHKSKNTRIVNEQTSMQQIIRFTIILDLYFNVLPQVMVAATYIYNLFGMDLQSYVGPVYRVLFVTYGLIINLRFYDCIVRRPAKIIIQNSQIKVQTTHQNRTLPIR